MDLEVLASSIGGALQSLDHEEENDLHEEVNGGSIEESLFIVSFDNDSDDEEGEEEAGDYGGGSLADYIADDVIPKIIHIYWNDPNIPKFVQICIDSIKKANEGWDVRVYSSADIEKIPDKPTYINKIPCLSWMKNEHIKFVSDWYRLHLLYEHGGVYIDASCYTTKNFVSFIDMTCNSIQGYNIWAKKYSDCMENSFIVAPPKCEFIKLWMDETIEIHNGNPVDYVCDNLYFYPDLEDNYPYLAQFLAWVKVQKKYDQPYKFIRRSTAPGGPLAWVHTYETSNDFKNVNVSDYDFLKFNGKMRKKFLNHPFFK